MYHVRRAHININTGVVAKQNLNKTSFRRQKKTDDMARVYVLVPP